MGGRDENQNPEPRSSLIPDPRPTNVVTYFGDYASAIRLGDYYVHIFRDGDRKTFCGLVGELSFGTPSVVGQIPRRSCPWCFKDCQQVRRDV